METLPLENAPGFKIGLARSGRSWVGAALLLSACTAQTGVAPTEGPPRFGSDTTINNGVPAGQDRAMALTPAAFGAPPARGAQLFPGTGRFVRQAGPSPAGAVEAGEGSVTLNFIDAPIDEVAAAILGDLLKVNYTIEPGVTGKVTIQTSQAIPRESLLPTLETLLGLNGAAIVDAGGLYKIVSLTTARQAGASVRSVSVPGLRVRGYAVEVVPLHFVPASEMEKILETLALKENILRADLVRNVLILAGTEQELQSLKEAIEIFDVDWLSGMSFGLFPIKYANAKVVTEELEKIFARAGGETQAQIVQFVPIERLNTILVVTQQRAFLQQARLWIARLDQKGDGTDRQVFVYYVQNGQAENLAASLTEIFGGEKSDKPTSSTLAPGLIPAMIGSSPADGSSAQGAGSAQNTIPPGNSAAGEGIVLPTGGTIRVIADKDHNALIVLATPQEYEMVEATLHKLDIVPLQVLIQASIVEVKLTDELKYGIRWFFERGNHSLLLDNSPAVTGGFSYTFSSTNFAAAIDALTAITDLKVMSSPELMVLDNQTASLQVGDQIPITVRQAVSVEDPLAPVVSSIQMRNTGVVLRVTPQVNAGGMVTMKIEQEVSDVAPSETPTTTPTIFQRTISSKVAVLSGESIALGGLISESTRNAQSGVPILSSIPILGALFRSTSVETNRTELLVLITPRVVSNQAEARIVTEDIRRRMGRVERFIREKKELGYVVNRVPPPAPSPGMNSSAPASSVMNDGTATGRATPTAGTVGAATASRTPAAAVATSPQRSETPAVPATDTSKKKPADLRPRKVEVAAVNPTGNYGRASEYFLHLASYYNQADAVRGWNLLSKAHPTILDQLQPSLQRADLGARGIYYRLRAGPIANKSVAYALCRRIQAKKQYCEVFRG